MSVIDESEQRKAILSTADGFLLPKVGTWAEEKYIRIGNYCEMFSTSMKNKWGSLVYLDLFAGAGKCIISKTGKVLLGSPLLALNARDPYSKYIFCESNTERMEALAARVNKYFPDRNCVFLHNDCNTSVSEILAQIPRHSLTHKVLTFCFVDPFKVSQLCFSTLQTIATKFVDFIVLIPSYMDINRNIKTYLRDNNKTIDTFLGYKEWREDWAQRIENPSRFIYFVIDKFCQQMSKLKYLYEKPEDFVLIKNKEDKNQPLYHLIFFSRNKTGLDFWRKIKDNKSQQGNLPFRE